MKKARIKARCNIEKGMAVMLLVMVCIFMPKLSALTQAAEVESRKIPQYGTNGYRCNNGNAKSGVLLIGDSRVCQLWKANQKGASIVAVWGGHYHGGTNSMSINNTNNRRIMKQYISQTLKKKNICKIYLFSAVNDYNGGNDTQAKVAADSLIKLAKTLRSHRVEITVVSLVGEKGKDVSDYNKYLKKHLPNKVRWLSIDSCLRGNNKGYSNDNLHYNAKTLKSIWKKLK